MRVHVDAVNLDWAQSREEIRSVSLPPSVKPLRTTTMSQPMGSPTNDTPQQRIAPEECLTCRIIGTGALAGVGFYALQMSRPKAPGSVLGKRIMGGVGVCEFLVQDALWIRVRFFNVHS